MRTSSWLKDTQTHTQTHTHAGNDNTWRLKLASGKNENLIARIYIKTGPCQPQSWFSWDSIFMLEGSAVNFHLKRHSTFSTYISQPSACHLLKGVHLSIPWPDNQQAWLSSTHAKALLENMHPRLNPIFVGPCCFTWTKTKYIFFWLSTHTASVFLTHSCD